MEQRHMIEYSHYFNDMFLWRIMGFISKSVELYKAIFITKEQTHTVHYSSYTFVLYTIVYND